MTASNDADAGEGNPAITLSSTLLEHRIASILSRVTLKENATSALETMASRYCASLS